MDGKGETAVDIVNCHISTTFPTVVYSPFSLTWWSRETAFLLSKDSFQSVRLAWLCRHTVYASITQHQQFD